VVQTARDNGDRLTPKGTVQWGPDFSSPLTITINPNQKFQTLLGFGGAFTEAAAYVYSTLNRNLQEKFVEAYWGPSGIRYTVGRIHMNSCDFSLGSYSADDDRNDFTLSNFTVAHDQKWLIPLVKAAINASQDHINFFLTPWSAPAWMKGNNKMDGSAAPLGMIQSAQVAAAWALFFSKFISTYKSQGIDFWGLTVQNEPENAASYESCLFTAEAERDFVKNYLGPRIAADHPNVNIMIFDHNKDHVATWAQTILSDPDAAKYVAGTAFHWYSGPQFENLAAAHNVAPNKFLLATEACNCPGVQLGNWPRAESYGYDIIGDLNNWAIGWTDWNILLNPQGGPNHVQNYCDAPVIGDSSAQTLYFQPTYYFMGQFSKFLLPGSVRIGSTSANGLNSVAVLRPDGLVALVVQNQNGDDYTFKLSQGNQAAKLTVTGHAIATFVYKNF